MESTTSLQTDLEEELRIEERRRSLRIEKSLMHHHKALAGILRDLELNPVYDASDPLRAALWCLGAAVTQAARFE